jgi:hypothetical protein
MSSPCECPRLDAGGHDHSGCLRPNVAVGDVSAFFAVTASNASAGSQPSSYSGVKLAEAFAIPDLDREIKWHCRYALQNGIHVSPTIMIDGLVQPDISSGDTVPDWVSRLQKI